MIVELLLPCLLFEARVYPSDPRRPTEIEMAALCFVQAHDDQGAQRDQLESFIGLGEAAFDEMLIRMVNRGWLRLEDMGLRLTITPSTKSALEAAASDAAPARLESNEEGFPVRVAYDLIGGGYAVIDDRLIRRAVNEARAVPVADREKLNNAPFGVRLDGFAPGVDDDPDDAGRRSAVMQALRADRNLNAYVLGGRRSTAAHVRVPAPTRAPTFDDVVYYKCRFEALAVRGRLVKDDEGEVPAAARRDGAAGNAEVSLKLVCVEARNPSIRRLGEEHAEAIVRIAIEAAGRGGPGGDGLLDHLLRNATDADAARLAAVDPLRILQKRLASEEGPEDEGADDILKDIEDLWRDALASVKARVAGRIDFTRSRPVPREEMSREVVALCRGARRSLLVSSPRLRTKSPELGGAGTAREAMAMVATRPGGAKTLVHAMTGATQSGQQVSDAKAVERLTTDLGADKIHLVDRAQDHMHTPFVWVDDEWLLWQCESLFDERPGGGLLLRLGADGAQSGFAQMAERLPASLRGRLPAERRAAPAGGPFDVLPFAEQAALKASLEDFELTLDRDGGDLEGPGRRSEFFKRLRVEVEYLIEWLAESSDSVAPLIGAAINERANEMLGPDHDREPVTIGVGEAAEARQIYALSEALDDRFARQDALGLAPATAVVIPRGGATFDEAALVIERRHGGRCALLRESRARGPGFVLGPTSALIASGGIVWHVPTAGRRIKGVHLGLHFAGHRARALAAKFLVSEWPAAAGALAAAPASPPPSRAPGAKRGEELLARFHREHWREDGNRGATQAARYLREGEDDPRVRRLAIQKNARAWLAGRPGGYEELGYALAKALAADPDADTSALKDLAEHAAGQNDLAALAILADRLSADSVYRDPLTRRLAYSLGRGEAPALTPTEQQALAEPTPAALCLGCLLMLDGLGGALADWLAYLPAEVGEPGEAALARALALRLRETGSRVVDLGPTVDAPPPPPEQLPETLRKLVSFIQAARTLALHMLPKQVVTLRERLFLKPDAFASELHERIEAALDEPDESARKALLREFLAERLAEIDPRLADASGVAALDPVAIAGEHFDRVNREVAHEMGRKPVDVGRGGRSILGYLERVVATLVVDLTPHLRDPLPALETALREAASAYLRAPPPSETGELARLRAHLRARLQDRRRSLARPFWLLPTLPRGKAGDWTRLRAAYLVQEFAPDASYEAVVRWFVEADRRRPGAASEAESPLLSLCDLLETARARGDGEDAGGALAERLLEIANSVGRRIEDARAFDAEVAGGLAEAIGEAAAARERLLDHLRAGDLIAATLAADELRRTEGAALWARWGEASRVERERLDRILADGLDAGDAGRWRASLGDTLKSILGEPIEVKALARGRTFARLAPRLSLPIPANPTLKLDIGERLPLPGRLGAAEGLMRLAADGLAGRRLGEAGAEKIAADVIGYFSPAAASGRYGAARLQDRLWRVSCGRPEVAALAFGLAERVEFVLPLDRDAELNWRRAAARTQTHEILISLFMVDELRDRAVLYWRELADAATPSDSARRVAVLGSLARRRFAASAKARLDWWEGLKSRQTDVAAALLSLDEERRDEDVAEADLADALRDLCLSLALSTGDSDERRLRPDLVQRIVGIWPRRPPGAAYGLSDAVRIFGELLRESAQARPIEASV